MDDTFYDEHDELYHHAKFGEDRTMRAGCIRCENVMFVFYRQDAAKRQTAGIKFSHRPKIRFFAPQGRVVAPIHVDVGKADGHLCPLGCAKFHLNRLSGVGMQPQNIKNFHFLVW